MFDQFYCFGERAHTRKGKMTQSSAVCWQYDGERDGSEHGGGGGGGGAGSARADGAAAGGAVAGCEVGF